MKNIIYLILGIMLTPMFWSCDQEIDYAYEGKSKVHFQHFKLDHNKKRLYFDSIVYSFGLKPVEIVQDTAKIVVEYMGDASTSARTYRVRVATDSTTAVLGVHYDTIAYEQTFRPDKLTDTLRILIYRHALSPSYTNPKSERLDLILEPSEDFDLGLNKGHRMKLLLNNYLSEPTWWEGNFWGSLDFYHPQKWRVLISFNEKFANALSCPFNSNNEGRGYVTGLRSYLSNVPTFDEETGDRVLMDKLVPVE